VYAGKLVAAGYSVYVDTESFNATLFVADRLLIEANGQKRKVSPDAPATSPTFSEQSAVEMRLCKTYFYCGCR
jgi:hypothetical protein